jgi:hypothetical protein
MKPCREKRKRIALLCFSALSEAEARALRTHLKACPGCQDYWSTMQEVCRQQTANARALPEVEASNRFHARLVRQITDGETGRAISGFPRQLLNWRHFPRWVWFTASALGLAIAIIWLSSARGVFESNPTIAENPLPSPQLPSRPATIMPAPSLAHYRQALNRSPEELDQLLTKESREMTPRKQSILSVRDRTELLARSDVPWPDSANP